MTALEVSPVSRIKPLINYVRKRQENKKFVKSIEVSATFSLVTFFLFFAIRPTFLTISKLQGDIESKKILKTELKNKINQIIQAQDSYSQVQEKYQLIDSSLPERPNYYQAASQIKKDSSDLSIPINSLNYVVVKVDENKPDPNFSSYDVDINIDGQFSKSVSLISQLLKNRRLMNIASIRLGTNLEANTASPSANGQINTRFASTFYYWPTLNEKK